MSNAPTCTCRSPWNHQPSCAIDEVCEVLLIPSTNWPKCKLAKGHEGMHLGFNWIEAGKSAYSEVPPGRVYWEEPPC